MSIINVHSYTSIENNNWGISGAIPPRRDRLLNSGVVFYILE